MSETNASALIACPRCEPNNPAARVSDTCVTHQRHAALLVPPWMPLWCVQMGEIVPRTHNGTHESRWTPGTDCPHKHLPVLIAVPRRGMYPGMTEYEPTQGDPDA